MKRMVTVLSIVLMSATGAVADTNSTESTSLEQAVEASGWTVSELMAALDMIEAKYNRDMKSKTGRESWHGKEVGQSVDTNSLTRTVTYEDGTSFTDAFKVVTPAESAKAYTAKLKSAVVTNGIPARLAAARLRQAQNSSTVSNVTVTVSSGAAN